MIAMMTPTSLAAFLIDALTHWPAVPLLSPSQPGKTTLTRK